VRKGQIELHPIARHTAVVTRELQELAADALNMTDIAEVRDGVLFAPKRFPDFPQERITQAMQL